MLLTPIANIAFSNGSTVGWIFLQNNKKTTHAMPNDIKRFFVTPEQSGKFICLQLLKDSGTIFFLSLDFHKDQIYF